MLHLTQLGRERHAEPGHERRALDADHEVGAGENTRAQPLCALLLVVGVLPRAASGNAPLAAPS